MKIYKNNIYVKKLRIELRKLFSRAPRYMYIYIIENADTIILQNKIPLTIFKSEVEVERFKKENSKKVLDDALLEIDVQIIVNMLKEYINDIKESRITYDIHDADINKYKYATLIDSNETDIDKILPTQNTNWMSVLHNLFKDSDVYYVYNKKIVRDKGNQISSNIRTKTFRLAETAENISYPIKYRVDCKANTDFGICNNIVEYFEEHLNSPIKCSDNSSTSQGHTIKKADAAIVEKKLFYGYFVYDEDDKDRDDGKNKEIIYSLYPIEKELFVCNYVTKTNGEDFKLVLGFEYIDDDTVKLEGNIITKHDGVKFFAEDIYQSIQEYYKTYHGLYLDDRNLVVAWVLIIQCLAKIIFNEKYNSMIVGQSGAGKTFLANRIVPFFTFNYAMVDGSSVTENRFIGGRSNVISKYQNSLFQPGLIETKDILVADEATQLLDALQDPRASTKSNMFDMLKPYFGSEGEGVDRGIQGSRSTTLNASIISFGNLEQLKVLRKSYRGRVASKYKNFSSGNVLGYESPYYKQPEWYLKNMDSETSQDLAKAHSIIRYQYMKDKNYITGLTESTMARFIFFIVLEDYDIKGIPLEYSGRKKNKYNIHKSAFTDELHNIFKDKNKIPESFDKEVFIWTQNYLLTERNNFVYIVGSNPNSHIREQVTNVAITLLKLNKMFYEQEFKFIEEDKKLLRWFFKRIYNTLDRDEASNKKEPAINDIYYSLSELGIYEHAKKEEYKQQLQDEKESLDLSMDDSGVVFGVDDDEFS